MNNITKNNKDINQKTADLPAGSPRNIISTIHSKRIRCGFPATCLQSRTSGGTTGAGARLIPSGIRMIPPQKEATHSPARPSSVNNTGCTEHNVTGVRNTPQGLSEEAFLEKPSSATERRNGDLTWANKEKKITENGKRKNNRNSH